MKIVISDNYGGYWLTKEAYEYLGLDWNKEVVYPMERAIPGFSKENELVGFVGYFERNNSKLVEMVESLGEKAGNHLVVVNVDEKRDWYIASDDDGWEKIRYRDETIGGR